MEGPWGDAELDALWAQGERAWHDAELGMTATVACYWCWSRDARCEKLLRVLPVHPHCATDVAEMCMYTGQLNADTIVLLHRYATLLLAGPECTRSRALRLCSSATRFLSSHTTQALEIIDTLVNGNVDQGVMPLRTFLQCTSALYPHATRCLAATLASQCPRPRSGMIMAHFNSLVDLAPTSDAALFLLDLVSCMWLPSLDQSRQLLRVLALPSVSAAAVEMLTDIAKQWPNQSVDGGVMLPLLKSGGAVPDEIMQTACHGIEPRNKEHLLVFLFKYGCPPASGLRMLADVLCTAPIYVRLVYTGEMDNVNSYREPDIPEPEGRLQGEHAGCTQFRSRDGVIVPVLTAQLVQYCGYFAADAATRETQVLNVAAEYTSDELDAFKQLVYYDRVPSYESACLLRVAALADMLCDARHASMCVFKVALVDFWPAYDVAKHWPLVKPVLAVAACRQLEHLVRCSRIAEVVHWAVGAL